VLGHEGLNAILEKLTGARNVQDRVSAATQSVGHLRDVLAQRPANVNVPVVDASLDNGPK